MMLGSHMLKMWSRTQATIALSSAEAELYGMVKASAESLGIVSLMKDVGRNIKSCILGDASAALGIIARKGLGKVRHLNTSYLWVQEKAANEEIKYKKVPGLKNIADLFTKPLDWHTIQMHTEAMNCRFTDGRDNMGYQINKLSYKNDADEKPVNEKKVKVELKQWCRTDLGTRTLKGTMRGGPRWSDVLRRRTYDADSGDLMFDEDARFITRCQENAEIGKGTYNTITKLIYRSHVK